jgi:hypothetical protein
MTDQTFFPLHDRDGDYSLARHLLAEIATAEPVGLGAADLGALVGDDLSGHRVGAWLRDLRARGWVYSETVSPASTVVRWHVTSA